MSSLSLEVTKCRLLLGWDGYRQNVSTSGEARREDSRVFATLWILSYHREPSDGIDEATSLGLCQGPPAAVDKLSCRHTPGSHSVKY